MRMVIGLSVIVLAVLTTTVQADEEKEKKISVSACPKAVQKTLKHEVGKGKIVDVDVRKIDGVAIYESEVWLGELEYDIVIRGDGTLLAKRLENDGDEADSDEGDDDDGDEQDGDDDGDEDEDEEEQETLVRKADLPKPVLKTLKREAQGGEIEEIEKETEDGKVVFEAEVEYETEDGELEYEIEIAEDGTLLSKVLEEEEGDEGDDEDEDEDDDEDEGDDEDEDDDDEDDDEDEDDDDEDDDEDEDDEDD